jgi:thioredoxin-related protein
VDGLEKELAGKASLIRLDIAARPGRDLAYRYSVRALPTFLVFDGKGNVVHRQFGMPDREAIIKAVESITGRE